MNSCILTSSPWNKRYFLESICIDNDFRQLVNLSYVNRNAYTEDSCTIWWMKTGWFYGYSYCSCKILFLSSFISVSFSPFSSEIIQLFFSFSYSLFQHKTNCKNNLINSRYIFQELNEWIKWITWKLRACEYIFILLASKSELYFFTIFIRATFVLDIINF